MSIDIPLWRLASGNGSVADLSKLQGQAPIKPTGHFDKADLIEQAPAFQQENASAVVLAQVQIYEHINFGGRSDITSLNWYYVGDWWNDKISSIVIYRGRWRFYQHSHYQGAYWDLGPGQYPWVEAANIPNDIISSFQLIGW